MKSALRAIIERLRQGALSAPQRVFDAGRARQPALEAHADVASVLKALDDASERTYPEREAITRALITEHRASGAASVWASVLLVAFAPMLVRLRNRLISDTVPGDELDQLVITSFLAALAEIPFEHLDRLALRLRRRTQRQVFAFLRDERAHRHPIPVDIEELADDRPEPLASRRRLTNERLYDLTLLLQRAAEEGFSPRGLDIVEATVLRCELLRSYVARVGPKDERARERMYQRLKRQRSRTIKRLKTLLGPSPALPVSGP